MWLIWLPELQVSQHSTHWLRRIHGIIRTTIVAKVLLFNIIIHKSKHTLCCEIYWEAIAHYWISKSRWTRQSHLQPVSECWSISRYYHATLTHRSTTIWIKLNNVTSNRCMCSSMHLKCMIVGKFVVLFSGDANPGSSVRSLHYVFNCHSRQQPR